MRPWKPLEVLMLIICPIFDGDRFFSDTTLSGGIRLTQQHI